jgi:hypothetical protein
MTNQTRDRPTVEERVCRAIRLLAEGTTADDVARAIRVRPATLAAWQESDDFRALLACMRENGRLHDALDALTPGAIAALRRALEGDDVKVAVSAAREVLDRVGLIRRKGLVSEESSEHTIRVEYAYPDGLPVSTTPWADRHPATPGALQSGGVRSPLREDGDGEDFAG